YPSLRMKKAVALLVMLLLLGLLVPGAAALNVVITMPNLWNVADEIGGDSVTVMYVAPPAAVHISSDTIDALLQQNSEFIKTADVFLGQGGTMDGSVITKVTEFRTKNFGEDTNWLLLGNVSTEAVPNATVTYDNPTSLRGYSEAVAYLLGTADPANVSVYQDNLQKYLATIADATKLSAAEKETLADIPILCHFRINLPLPNQKSGGQLARYELH
ncbi:MAG: zinc ABC transporter substrate-binding protein, partial [Methanocalculaceae archaeon]|nr:zinc ABC transporter substrate-binding protein [Methanocalculaceae archaeon]